MIELAPHFELMHRIVGQTGLGRAAFFRGPLEELGEKLRWGNADDFEDLNHLLDP